ncbi:hypothetical protein [Pseudoalteromonas spongiae]|uniref:hypothetical protein n=1 Tax=Pseudoalteromonas spongiae TaxID=298657 RepID=UPI000C2D16CC|nr:hypothetical protein [Pseudoalteromonas spongiae]
MKKAQNITEAMDAVKAFFANYGNVTLGFYQLAGTQKDGDIFIQPVDLQTVKSKSVNLLLVLAKDATATNALDDLLATSESLQQAITNAGKNVNAALGGKLIQFQETEPAKIIAPESNERVARALFTLNIKY